MKTDTAQLPKTNGVSEELSPIDNVVLNDYKYGFVTDIESDSAPMGLSEDIVRFISAKKNEPEWMLEWRLKASRHWLKMEEPKWANIKYPPINYGYHLLFCSPNKNQSEKPGRDRSRAEKDLVTWGFRSKSRNVCRVWQSTLLLIVCLSVQVSKNSYRSSESFSAQ
jgi:hypothetical protein